jgi:hypothetical protein
VVWRLVVDVVWRSRWIYAMLSPILVSFWLIYVAGGVGVFSLSLPALSLVVTAVLGPMLVPLAVGLRALRHLPTTDRDLWRTTWVAAVIATPAFVLATQMIAVLLVTMFGGRSEAPIETILLSALYDLAWAGALLPLLRLGTNLGLAFGAVVGFTDSIAGLLVCFGLPLLLSEALPARLAALTPTVTAVLTGCFAIAIASLAWTPPRRMRSLARVQARRGSDLATGPTRIRLADRLTGVRRVTVPSLLTTVAVVVGACLVLAVYGVASGSGAWWFVPRELDLFDPANRGDRGLTYVLLVPCTVITTIAIWTPWARLLKVLPLSVRQINALLLVTPFATWVWLWLIGLALYSLAYGAPTTLRLDLPFGLAGMAALTQALFLRWSGRFTGIAGTAAMLPQLLRLGLRDATSAQVTFGVIGAIALVAAAVINHRTLTRSTSSSLVYRRPQPPFGMRKTASVR